VNQEATGTLVPLVERYLSAVDEILQGSPSDDELLSRVRGLPGGLLGAVTLIGFGLPAAFLPELAAGETGTVAFILDTDGEPMELCVEVRPDRCRVIPAPPLPTSIVRMPAVTFLKIAFKVIDGTDAYMDGLIVADGDIVLAASFGEWFDRAHVGLVKRATELGLSEDQSWLAGKDLSWLTGQEPS
jgi:hypothetical protein